MEEFTRYILSISFRSISNFEEIMPSLKNILVRPKARVLYNERLLDTGKQKLVLQVSGLMCRTICVRRVQASLGKQRGVTNISLDPANDIFTVEYVGSEAKGARFIEAALAPVIAPRFRAIVEHCWIYLRHMTLAWMKTLL